MDNKEDKDQGSCGCGGGKCRCCGGRAALVLVLMLIGGLIGYAIGHCHSGRWSCPYSTSPMAAPAVPGK